MSLFPTRRSNFFFFNNIPFKLPTEKSRNALGLKLYNRAQGSLINNVPSRKRYGPTREGNEV